MKSINIQNLKVGGEIITTEAEVPSELADLTKDTTGYKNLEALKVMAGNGIAFNDLGDYVEITASGSASSSGQINTVIYDNATLKDHLDEIMSYTNTENGGTLLSIGFKVGTAEVVANATKAVIANGVSPVVSTVSQIVLKAGTFYSFRSADIETNKLILNGLNGIEGCSSTNLEITVSTCSMNGCGSKVNTDGTLETICFNGIDLLSIPLEHLVIYYFTIQGDK